MAPQRADLQRAHEHSACDEEGRGGETVLRQAGVWDEEQGHRRSRLKLKNAEQDNASIPPLDQAAVSAMQTQRTVGLACLCSGQCAALQPRRHRNPLRHKQALFPEEAQEQPCSSS